MYSTQYNLLSCLHILVLAVFADLTNCSLVFFGNKSPIHVTCFYAYRKYMAQIGKK